DNQPAHRVVVEAHATVGDGRAEQAADVRQSVHGDLAGAAVELLQHVGAGAQCERERRTYVACPQLDGFFDEELATTCGRCGLAHDRLEDSHRSAFPVDGRAALGRVDD